MGKRVAERLATVGQGLFDPDGVFWRVNRESVLLIGGGTALLMQVAHPKIAAGITHHSEFRERPIRRLYRTIKVMQDIIYGDRATALSTAESIRQIHARVNGKLSESTSLFAVGTSYSAEDPELVLWVYATLIDTMLGSQRNDGKSSEHLTLPPSQYPLLVESGHSERGVLD